MSYQERGAKPGPKVLEPGHFSSDFIVGGDVMLSERVRFLRLCMGISQAQLAQKARVCLPTIHRAELGYGLGRIDVLRKICNALDCRLEINFKPNRQPTLDHRVLTRAGRIARRPRVKTREEGARLDGLLAHLNPSVADRVKHRKRHRVPSEMAAMRIRQMQAEVAAEKDKPPEPSPPST